MDPWLGILAVITAHNQLDRIAGYAPAQWAYGRLPDFDGRLFEGGNSVPFHSTEGTLGTDLRANLQIRVKAEEQYRRTQAVSQISRAMNSQPRRFEVFVPGDLVYYKRFQVPHGQKPSHVGLDKPKTGLARWYGPARVLATETATEVDPPTRKPGGIVWIVAASRLKRCSPHQLRHCSEREKILAEASGAITLPWSFSSLLHLVEKGQFERFDDLIEDEFNPAFRERQIRSERGRSRSRARSVPVERAQTKGQVKKETTTAKRAEPIKAGPSRQGERRSKEDSGSVGRETEEKKKKQRQTPGQLAWPPRRPASDLRRAMALF